MESALGALYRDHVELEYTCVDRIHLKGYASILHSCGGFRTWAERIRPNEPVTQAWIQSLGRRFHDNVKKFAAEREIPIITPAKGQRRHLLADQYRQEFNRQEGVYLIVRSFENSHLFVSEEPRQPTDSTHRNLKRRFGFVAHYYFYIVDRHWGPMSVAICSHPPFNARVLLNAHHWVERRAEAQKLPVEKETNAFLATKDPDRLQRIANSLSESDIRRVADRWTYRVLPVLSYQQRHDSRFRYQWSIAQMEACHNLVFHRRFPLAELFQRHIDLSRRLLGPDSIATVFGRKQAAGRENISVSVHQTHVSRTVLRVKHNKSVLKEYDKHHRILRTECVSNDSTAFGVGKRLCNFAALRARMTDVLGRFLHLQRGSLNSTLDRGQLTALAQTSELGRCRVPGIRLENERIMTVLHLLARIGTTPAGFSSAHLRELYCSQTQQPYSSAQASYDLRKLRAKRIVASVPRTRRYVLTNNGAAISATLYNLRTLLIGPTLASATACAPPTSSHVSAAKRRGPKPDPIPSDRLRRLLARHAGNVSAAARELNRQSCVVRRWIQRDGLDLEHYRRPVARPDIENAYHAVDRALIALATALALDPAA